MPNDESWRKRIVCDPNLHHGEPCVRGTRIPVAVIVASLADVSTKQLLKAFPQLKLADIKAALLYASEASHNTLVA